MNIDIIECWMMIMIIINDADDDDVIGMLVFHDMN